MDKIAILIPCRNEARTIAQVVLDYRAALPEAAVYVYDNASDDGTDDLARNAGAIVRTEPIPGKGNVIRRMFREVDAQVYLMVDGDGTYPADDARKVVEPVLSGRAEMVIGDRLSSTYFTENKRAFHNFGNVLVRWSINHLFGCDFKDILTGMRAFSYGFVKSFPVLSRGFEIETEMTIHAADKNLAVVSVPVQYRDRQAGSESKLNTLIDGAKVLRRIVVLFKNYRPFAFFNLFALVIALICAAAFAPIFIMYLQTGLVPRLPTLVALCGGLIVAAISFFSGLILDVLRQKARHDFEMRLLVVQDRLNDLLTQG
ncbi:MAG: glycosyltransferase [Oscillospiraceae bacterium]|jgi:glycosyltransferase involved in cell wall biosynthesis|nr:glycosyltransferase [Oscillospiraceae bacterium]